MPFNWNLKNMYRMETCIIYKIIKRPFYQVWFFISLLSFVFDIFWMKECNSLMFDIYITFFIRSGWLKSCPIFATTEVSHYWQYFMTSLTNAKKNHRHVFTSVYKLVMFKRGIQNYKCNFEQKSRVRYLYKNR